MLAPPVPPPPPEEEPERHEAGQPAAEAPLALPPLPGAERRRPMSRAELKEASRRRAAASLKIMADRARPTTWTGGKLGARREAKAQLLSASLIKA